jgi:hypothetical protein
VKCGSWVLTRKMGGFCLQNAPLTEPQLAAVGALAVAAAEHPLPSHVVSLPSSLAETGGSDTKQVTFSLS